MSPQTKTIAVLGATGVQGGSVVRALLKDEWKIRAITRDVSKEAAKSLAKEEGVEVVSANIDDGEGLGRVFEVRFCFDDVVVVVYPAVTRTHPYCML